MTKWKSMIALLLCAALLLGAGSIAAAALSGGEIVGFGTYPQSLVTDEDLLAELNALELEWTSYGYFTPTPPPDLTEEEFQPEEMKFADVSFGGSKYRAVFFSVYRPGCMGDDSIPALSWQDDNGYIAGLVYWFRFDPLKWRILDASKGLMLCTTIIDSQPYNTYIMDRGVDADGQPVFYGHPEADYFANDYSNSSIRKWLNEDFFNTAFTDEEKADIYTTHLENPCFGSLQGWEAYAKYDAPDTDDKVFLLSYTDAMNVNYGFNQEARDPQNTTVKAMDHDPIKRMQGSDYAKCQGLYVSGTESYTGNSIWWLRTPSSGYSNASVVFEGGNMHSYNSVDRARNGVVPAVCVNPNSALLDSNPHNHVYSAAVTRQPTLHEDGVTTYTCTICGAFYTEPIPALDTLGCEITVGTDYARPGTVAKVPLILDRNPGLASFSLGIQFDSSLLELIEVEMNPEFGGTIEKKERLVWANGEDSLFTGRIATLKFLIAEDAQDGKLPITLTYAPGDIVNADEQEIKTFANPGFVRVTSYLPGDINGDGAVNNKDLVRLMKYLSGEEDLEVVVGALDINDDNVVNSKDLTRLMKYLAGEEVEIH